MSRDLGILLIGEVDQSLGTFLKQNLLRYLKVFNDIILIEKAEPILKKAYSQERGQYLADEFLLLIDEWVKKRNFYRMLGVTNVDLYVSRLNFVFGVARSPSCIISIHRLYAEFYGSTPNQALFLERTLKEAIHEIGHTLGLNHCENFCIMRFSNSILDTDAKPKEFCISCNKRLL